MPYACLAALAAADTKLACVGREVGHLEVDEFGTTKAATETQGEERGIA